jgi:ABC-2 type transport system ATP-binding protein
VLLTTQYLDEADRLASVITVLADGRVIASAPTEELKAKVGRRTVTVAVRTDEDLAAATAALLRAGLHPTSDESRRVLTTPVDASADLAAVVRAMDEASVDIAGLAVAEPTLDDAYLALNERRHPVAAGATSEVTA